MQDKNCLPGSLAKFSLAQGLKRNCGDSQQLARCATLRFVHLAVDIRAACEPQRTGKGQWTLSFCKELLVREHRVTLLAQDGAPIPSELSGAAVRMLPGGVRWHGAARKVVRELRPDVALFPTSFIVSAFSSPHDRTAILVHDMVAFSRGSHDRRAQWIERLTLPRALRQATLRFALSEATREELLKRFPQAGNVPVLGAGPQWGSPPQRVQFPVGICCVGTLCERKNQARLLKAFTLLPPALQEHHPLVIAGGEGWGVSGLPQKIEHTPHARYAGYVNAEEYRKLLQSAAVIVVPSLQEGMGLAMLDALSCGIPLVLSDIPIFREVAGNAAEYCDPRDTASIAAAVQRALQPERAQRLSTLAKERSSLWSWKTVVDRFLNACRALPPR